MENDDQKITLFFTQNFETTNEIERTIATKYEVKRYDARSIGGPDLSWLPTGLFLFLISPLFWSGKKIFEKLGDDIYDLLKNHLAKSRQKIGENYIYSPVGISVVIPQSSRALYFYLPPYPHKDNTDPLSEIDINVPLLSEAMDAIPNYLVQFNSSIQEQIKPLISSDVTAIALHYEEISKQWVIVEMH